MIKSPAGSPARPRSAGGTRSCGAGRRRETPGEAPGRRSDAVAGPERPAEMSPRPGSGPDRRETAAGSEADGQTILARVGAGRIAALEPLHELGAAEPERLARRLGLHLVSELPQRLDDRFAELGLDRDL